MSCAYKPSSSTESFSRLQTGVTGGQCMGGFGNSTYAGGARVYPYDCGYSVFIPKQPGPGFSGTLFEDTTTWMKPYLQAVTAAVNQETRSGYPRSSYVPLSEATRLPPQFQLCNQ